MSPHSKEKLWFLIENLESGYRGRAPFFLDKNEFPWVSLLEKNWHIIREELSPLLNNEHSLQPYFSKERQSDPRKWKTTGFIFWGRKHKSNREKYPKTTAILDKIPGIIGATVNLLEPYGRILPHHGETNANIRAHLGLVVPAPHPDCGFKVGSEERGWEEGKVFLFTDAHEHTAWNHSNRRRYVLIIDILHTHYSRQKYHILCSVMGMQSLMLVYSIFNLNLPARSSPALLFMFYTMRVFWYIYMPVHRTFGNFLYRT